MISVLFYTFTASAFTLDKTGVTGSPPAGSASNLLPSGGPISGSGLGLNPGDLWNIIDKTKDEIETTLLEGPLSGSGDLWDMVKGEGSGFLSGFDPKDLRPKKRKPSAGRKQLSDLRTKLDRLCGSGSGSGHPTVPNVLKGLDRLKEWGEKFAALHGDADLLEDLKSTLEGFQDDLVDMADGDEQCVWGQCDPSADADPCCLSEFMSCQAVGQEGSAKSFCLPNKDTVEALREVHEGLGRGSGDESGSGTQGHHDYLRQYRHKIQEHKRFMESAEGCYNADYERVKQCMCHSTCKACGFYDAPVDEDDCFTCESGYELVSVYRADFDFGWATGKCVQKPSEPPTPFHTRPPMKNGSGNGPMSGSGFTKPPRTTNGSGNGRTSGSGFTKPPRTTNGSGNGPMSGSGSTKPPKTTNGSGDDATKGTEWINLNSRAGASSGGGLVAGAAPDNAEKSTGSDHNLWMYIALVVVGIGAGVTSLAVWQKCNSGVKVERISEISPRGLEGQRSSSWAGLAPVASAMAQSTTRIGERGDSVVLIQSPEFVPAPPSTPEGDRMTVTGATLV